MLHDYIYVSKKDEHVYKRYNYLTSLSPGNNPIIRKHK